MRERERDQGIKYPIIHVKQSSEKNYCTYLVFVILITCNVPHTVSFCIRVTCQSIMQCTRKVFFFFFFFWAPTRKLNRHLLCLYLYIKLYIIVLGNHHNCVFIWNCIFYYLKKYIMYQDSNRGFKYRIKFKFN